MTSYPFVIDRDLLRLVGDPVRCNGASLLYLFLLSVTRSSMDSRFRRLNGIDPTLVFEQTCADVLLRFWNGINDDDVFSDVFVVGTSAESEEVRKFPSMISELCTRLKEGGGWKDGAKSPGAGDGGLDLVVWRRFSDDRPGGLVAFAQCKTGEHWDKHLGRHNPESICHNYFRVPLLLNPLSIYMVPCRIDRDSWDDAVKQNCGILFDRCRLVQYGERLSEKSVQRCRTWFELAIERERGHFSRRLGVTLPDGKRRGKK